MKKNTVTFRSAGACLVGLALLATPALAQSNRLPRTPEGKPDFQGIWQVRNRAAYDLEDHHAGFGTLAGESVVEGNTIPYHPAEAEPKAKNVANRQTLDPASKCYMPNAFEMGGINQLYRSGWRKEDLPIGAEVTIDGYLSRTDPHVANSQTIFLADGRKLVSPVPGPTGRKPEAR